MTPVLEPIDWTRRPFRPMDADGPPMIGPLAGATPRGGNWSIVPRVPGEILTAAKYNADRQVMVDNATPLAIDDYSQTIGEMQAETNPYPGGAVSQAVSLAGELERLRWCIHQINPTADAWYAAVFEGLNIYQGTFFNLHVLGNLTVDNEVRANQFITPNNRPYSTYWSNGTTVQNLIFMGTDDKIHVGWGLPPTNYIMLGTGARVQSVGVFEAQAGIAVTGQLVMQKDQWIYWSDRAGISVRSSDNRLELGLNCSQLFVHPPTVVHHLTVTGVLTANVGIGVVGQLVLQKGQWLQWSDMNGIVVDTSNNLGLGLNCAWAFVYPDVNFSRGIILQKGNALSWGDKAGILMDAANNVGIGPGCAQLVVYPPASFLSTVYVNGNVTMQKGTWLMASDIAMIAVAAADNALYIGSNASFIHLNSNTHVLGSLGTSGDIVAGANGLNTVHARNVAHAWARINMGPPPSIIAGINLTSVVTIAPGTVRLTLHPAVASWASAVATPESFAPEALLCTVTLVNDHVLDVSMRAAATGAPRDWFFTVVMY